MRIYKYVYIGIFLCIFMNLHERLINMNKYKIFLYEEHGVSLSITEYHDLYKFALIFTDFCGLLLTETHTL